MFYHMITNARNRWLASAECTVKNLIAYIENAGQMRDAQIDAIKTYLFFKISCDCQSLSYLFQVGQFNTLDLQAVELSATTGHTWKGIRRRQLCWSMRVSKMMRKNRFPKSWRNKSAKPRRILIIGGFSAMLSMASPILTICLASPWVRARPI